MRTVSLLIVVACVVFAFDAKGKEDRVLITEWGKLATGESVKLISLNIGEVSAQIATYGAQIVRLSVPDRNGNLQNVVLGHPNLEDALTKGTLGSVIGRYANRISGGGFSIDGTRYDLESVNPKTGIQIHGGKTGFQNQNWEIEADPESVGFEKYDLSITLRLFSKDGHEGFPGNLTVWVQYRLKDTDPGTIIGGVGLTIPTCDLEMEFRAKTDKPTHVNLTNHAYFNLRGGSVLGHRLELNCGEYLEFDDRNIPTGKILPVEGTRFDFRKPDRVDRGMEFEEYKGLDHCFVVPKDGNVGRLSEEVMGIHMDIWTTQPGVQLYTANHFQGDPYPKYGAICFETQHYPDSANQAGFPTTLLRPGEMLIETTKYRFRKDLVF